MAEINQSGTDKSTTWAMFEEPSAEIKRAIAHISKKTPTPSARRRPRQERSRFTVAAILEAAAEVIDDVGWDRASTNRIAERAGVSIGSLYQYFPNKEAILTRLEEHHRTTVHGVVAAALERIAAPTVAVAAALRALFDDLIELHRDDPVLTRVLATQVPRHTARRRGEEDNRLIHRLEEILVLRPDVRAGDTVAVAHVLATTTEALTRWIAHEAPEQLDVPTLVDEMVAMLSGYITGPSVARDDSRQTSRREMQGGAQE